jgi:hypothetical protein
MSGAGGLIVYSSKTGNTRKLAEGIRGGLAEALGAERGAAALRIAAVEENPDPSGAGWILAGFWADRGNNIAVEVLKAAIGARQEEPDNKIHKPREPGIRLKNAGAGRSLLYIFTPEG